MVAGRRAGDAIACAVSGTERLLPFPEPYRTRVADGESITIGLRPEHFRLTRAGEASGLPSTVEMVELTVWLHVPPQPLYYFDRDAKRL